MKLLFNSTSLAQEVAFMLRCDYDGCNGVTLPSGYDAIAVHTAIELSGAQFCFEGDHLPLEPLLSLEEKSGSLTDEQLADVLCRRLGERCYLSPF